MRFLYQITMLVMAFCVNAPPVNAVNWWRKAWDESASFASKILNETIETIEWWHEIKTEEGLKCFDDALQQLEQKFSSEAKEYFQKQQDFVLVENQFAEMPNMTAYCEMIRRIPEETRDCEHEGSRIMSQFKDGLCEGQFSPYLAHELKLVVKECQGDETTPCYYKASITQENSENDLILGATCDYDNCIIKCARKMKNLYHMNVTHFLDYFSFKHNMFVDIHSNIMASFNLNPPGAKAKCRNTTSLNYHLS